MLSYVHGLAVLIMGSASAAIAQDSRVVEFQCRVGGAIDSRGTTGFEYRVQGTALRSPSSGFLALDEDSLRLDVDKLDYSSGRSTPMLSASALELVAAIGEGNNTLVFRAPASRYGLEITIDRSASAFSVNHTFAPGDVFTAAGDCLIFAPDE